MKGEFKYMLQLLFFLKKAFRNEFSTKLERLDRKILPTFFIINAR